ncbi:uracil phosphoribosyltransferase [Candidatus Microgenomates bacterium]|nr:MAG: uracil phosphoribosyltransferase [Candidatus Microgenomates bacterium]
MQNLTIVQHPLLSHSLTMLREKTTQTAQFRQHSAIVSKILLIEATKSLENLPMQIETPLIKTQGEQLRTDLLMVPVLRAGLAMLFAVQDFLPSVPVGFIGLERDEQTAIAREYYAKFPPYIGNRHILILDPMLATGGSCDDAIGQISQRGGSVSAIVCVLAAPEGIKRIHDKFPEVTIITGAVDEKLNDKKYIVPGLGDFGDRYFGT